MSPASGVGAVGGGVTSVEPMQAFHSEVAALEKSCEIKSRMECVGLRLGGDSYANLYWSPPRDLNVEVM